MGAIEMEARVQARVWSVNPKLVAAAILFGGGLLFTVGLIADRPITFPDEAIYSGAARSLSAGHGFEVAGTPISAWTYGPLYIAILAPIYRLAPDPQTAYLVARAVNALFFTSAAVPIFFIARRVVSKRSATFVAAAGLALPASVYTTKLQTESLAYPATMWVALAALSVVALPTTRRQVVLVSLIAAASLVRFELVALAPGAFGACFVSTQGSLRVRLRRLSPLVGSLVAPSIIAASL